MKFRNRFNAMNVMGTAQAAVPTIAKARYTLPVRTGRLYGPFERVVCNSNATQPVADTEGQKPRLRAPYKPKMISSTAVFID